MKQFIEFVFPVTAGALRGDGYQAAIRDILVFKDKIYTGTVILPADAATITNCTFLGSDTAIKIQPANNTPEENAAN